MSSVEDFSLLSKTNPYQSYCSKMKCKAMQYFPSV